MPPTQQQLYADLNIISLIGMPDKSGTLNAG